MWIFTGATVLGGLVLGTALWWSGTLTHAVAVHGALMLTAWGVLIPTGAVVARYFKVTSSQDFPNERDNPFWWDWHRRCQYGGIATASVGLIVILAETGGRFDTAHGRCGLIVLLVGWAQVVSTLFRGTKGGPTDHRADPRRPATWRGDHYDMTLRRRLFEAWHKTAGWAVIVVAGMTILLGIELVGAPAWLLAIAGILQGGVGLAVLDGRLHGRWVDTHAALWGPGLGGAGERTDGTILRDRVLNSMADPKQRPIILVVDDEELLRLLAADVLEDHGYTVLEAADATAALGILEERRDVSVVFTDINMPGPVDGMDLAREIHARWPAVKLLVTSGRAQLREDEIPDHGRFVAKPYSPDELVGGVDRAIHRS